MELSMAVNYFKQLTKNKNMGYFKIKNTTTLLPKRHGKVNTTQSIEIKDGFAVKIIDINPNEEFLLETGFLPISLHKLRAEGVVSIIELDKNSYHRDIEAKKKSNPSPVESPQVIDTKVIDEIIEDSSEERKKKNSQKFTKKDN